MSTTLSRSARFAATIISVVAIIVLFAQVLVSSEVHDGVLPALWALARYFTILTNILVAVTFSAMALTGRAPSPGWLAGLTLWILIVGVVYHALLAATHNPVGLDWWTNQGLHTVNPAVAALWWLAYAPKGDLGVKHAGWWLAWPVVYVAYALVRSPLDGIYPYFFIDVSLLGVVQVALNVGGLSLAFFIGGLGMVGLGRLFSR